MKNIYFHQKYKFFTSKNGIRKTAIFEMQKTQNCIFSRKLAQNGVFLKLKNSTVFGKNSNFQIWPKMLKNIIFLPENT